MKVAVLIASTIVMTPVRSNSFADMWMGRIAWPPASGIGSVYWEGQFDARGKKFNPEEISCAHRTEKLGKVLVVTNLDNGIKIDCPVQDRGPYFGGRVIDLSAAAGRALRCYSKPYSIRKRPAFGLCNLDVKRKGYE